MNKHKLWLNDENDGKRADLYNIDCSGLDFSNNDLRFIYFYRINLTKANLSDCDLSGAILEKANLTDAILKNVHFTHYSLKNVKGLITTEDYMKNNFEFDIEKDGYIVYKTFGSRFVPPRKWIIKENSVIEENCDIDRRDACSYGINCGTLDWVRNYNKKYNLPIWKMLIKKEWLNGVAIPYSTSGKFRCNKAQLLNIVE